MKSINHEISSYMYNNMYIIIFDSIDYSMSSFCWLHSNESIWDSVEASVGDSVSDNIKP